MKDNTVVKHSIVWEDLLCLFYPLLCCFRKLRREHGDYMPVAQDDQGKEIFYFKK